MGNSRFLFWVLLCTIIYVSCSTLEENNEPQINSILNSLDGADVRGSSIGDKIEDVLEREQDNIVHNMPDEITCKIPISIKDSTYYDIIYNFNDNGLHVIELDVFPSHDSAASSLFNDLHAFYNKRYGSSTADDGYSSWFTKSQQGKDIEVTMINESKEMNKPYLSITFYENSLN